LIKEEIMEFYNVKTKQKVDIPDSDVKKVAIVQKNGKHTYAVTAEDNGSRLFRFVSKQQYDALRVSESEAPARG
jgi:hypothetical protein